MADVENNDVLVPVEYVGNKPNGRADTVTNSGAVWGKKGDVINVSASNAARLFQHPDIWADPRKKGAVTTEPVVARQTLHVQAKKQEDEGPPLANFMQMDAAQLSTYHQQYFGTPLDTTMHLSTLRSMVVKKVQVERA